MDEAIRCSTANGAYALFEENIKGALELGQLAELVVWDHDLMTVDPTTYMSVMPERTMLGGRWVYEAKGRESLAEFRIIRASSCGVSALT